MTEDFPDIAKAMDAYVIVQTAESQGRAEVQDALAVSAQLASGTFSWTEGNIKTLRNCQQDDEDELNAPTLRMGEDRLH